MSAKSTCRHVQIKTIGTIRESDVIHIKHIIIVFILLSNIVVSILLTTKQENPEPSSTPLGNHTFGHRPWYLPHLIPLEPARWVPSELNSCNEKKFASRHHRCKKNMFKGKKKKYTLSTPNIDGNIWIKICSEVIMIFFRKMFWCCHDPLQGMGPSLDGNTSSKLELTKAHPIDTSTWCWRRGHLPLKSC